MNNIDPSLQNILEAHGAPPETISLPCPFCGEEEDDCSCEFCENCEEVVIPNIIRGLKECPECGWSMSGVNEDQSEEDNSIYLSTEIAALKRQFE